MPATTRASTETAASQTPSLANAGAASNSASLILTDRMESQSPPMVVSAQQATIVSARGPQ